jgi:hypothetical protein
MMNQCINSSFLVIWVTNDSNAIYCTSEDYRRRDEAECIAANKSSLRCACVFSRLKIVFLVNTVRIDKKESLGSAKQLCERTHPILLRPQRECKFTVHWREMQNCMEKNGSRSPARTRTSLLSPYRRYEILCRALQEMSLLYRAPQEQL